MSTFTNVPNVPPLKGASKAKYLSILGPGVHWSSWVLPTVRHDVYLQQEKHISFVDAVVMILRLWAMYNRSRFILATLLSLYVIETVSYLVYCVVLGTQNQLVGT